jgi:hypothetical protein
MFKIIGMIENARSEANKGVGYREFGHLQAL